MNVGGKHAGYLLLHASLFLAECDCHSCLLGRALKAEHKAINLYLSHPQNYIQGYIQCTMPNDLVKCVIFLPYASCNLLILILIFHLMHCSKK